MKSEEVQVIKVLFSQDHSGIEFKQGITIEAHTA